MINVLMMEIYDDDVYDDDDDDDCNKDCNNDCDGESSNHPSTHQCSSIIHLSIISLITLLLSIYPSIPSL